MAERCEVVFVGGAAFSGAELVAGLLGAHPRLAASPVAARFHSDERGMPALLGGQVGLDDFLDRLRGEWWSGAGGEPGLGEVVARSRLESGIERFRSTYHRDPLAACRELFVFLLGPLAGEGRLLVEWSAGNLRQAQVLVRLFGDARFVHVVRDGRDVASAAAPQNGGGLAAGLRRWVGELREIESAVRGEEDGAPYAIPAGRLGVVVLDQLAAGDRVASCAALLELLALGDDPGVGPFLDHPLGPLEVGRGGWRAHARGPGAWALGRRYRRVLAALEREGNHAAPPLIEAYERLG